MLLNRGLSVRLFVSPFKADLWMNFSGSYPGSSAGFVLSPVLLRSAAAAVATPAETISVAASRCSTPSSCLGCCWSHAAAVYEAVACCCFCLRQVVRKEPRCSRSSGWSCLLVSLELGVAADKVLVGSASVDSHLWRWSSEECLACGKRVGRAWHCRDLKMWDSSRSSATAQSL